MKKTILIVDDDPDIRFTVKDNLEGTYSEEFAVIEADGGHQCFELLQKQQPDLILLDIMMPQMSGWEVYEELKKHSSWKKIPVVFLTARTDDVAREAGNVLGKDYIEKPFEITDLKKRIDSALKKRLFGKF
jgi:DNA-binding response OmpR family regulator